VLVRLCYRMRSKRVGWEYCMELEVEVPCLPVVLQLRPQTRAEARQIETRRAVDLATGDAAFDSAFIVEGAPADVVKEWLDAETRARALAAGPVIITLRRTSMTLYREGWQPAQEGPLMELLGRMALRLPGALAEAKRAYVASRAGYRGDTDNELGKERAEKWRAELLALAGATERRGSARRWRLILLLLGAAAGIVLLGVIVELVFP